MVMEIRPMLPGMKSWFEKNYPEKKWEDLTANKRFELKLVFKNRNNPYVVSKNITIPKFIEFLRRKKESGNTYFEGGLEDILKEAKTPSIHTVQASKIMKENFPNTFSYKGIKFEDLPNIEEEVVKLAKQKIPPTQAFKILLDNKIVRAPAGNVRKKNNYNNLRKFYTKLVDEKRFQKNL